MLPEELLPFIFGSGKPEWVRHSSHKYGHESMTRYSGHHGNHNVDYQQFHMGKQILMEQSIQQTIQQDKRYDTKDGIGKRRDSIEYRIPQFARNTHPVGIYGYKSQSNQYRLDRDTRFAAIHIFLQQACQSDPCPFSDPISLTFIETRVFPPSYRYTQIDYTVTPPKRSMLFFIFIYGARERPCSPHPEMVILAND